MNKLFLLPMTIFLIILSACTNHPGTPVEPNENNMIITIKNNANFDFYGLETAILNHSPSMINADGSKISKGEELRFEFLKDDFELDGEADMEVRIITDIHKDDGSDRIPINKKMPLQLVNNQELFFELTGDSIQKAELRRVNN
ncbi:hypothetical protein [Neobacillus niacini]|uniref:hypothetical protein n=1 Tax=Neobacillus niacini TaxID=86668 RepID=UPI0021CB2CA3|nr:hypothetical protein [Neobacillus niacini]MCM3766079.1 hypothetical protein [Neobacillus niacini]